MEEKISENCIDGKLLNEMADSFSDIIKKWENLLYRRKNDYLFW